MKKPLPIGISDFKKVIDEGYAYVDKTLLIQEIVEKGTEVVLIPRPRRFGKTLNLSMLRYFFEKGEHDVSKLFKHLEIWNNARCRALAGQFPVIFLTLKDIKHSSWNDTFQGLRGMIAREFKQHKYLFEELSAEDKTLYHKILTETAEQPLIEQSLLLLTEWLHRHHGKRVILLIDEYDTPAHEAYSAGYYEPFIKFLRNWLSAGLKDNTYLERGVLTGILRIAKESVFSGLNNIQTFTILDEVFQDKFGLLESEVKNLLEDYCLTESHGAMKEWYDGYRIGSCGGLYNPWSVLNCIHRNGALAPYWINTSDNALMKQVITRGTGDLKADIEELLKGCVIEKTIKEGIVFAELKNNLDAVWSLLLFSGYLTIDATPSYGTPCRLRIPNIEVTEVYKSMILDWFKTSIDPLRYRQMLDSLIAGDIATFSLIFQEFMLSSLSVFDVADDEPEKVYHAFVLGMLLGLQGRYEVKSNRESGYGRYDVCLIPKNSDHLGIIMEFKKVSRFEKIDLDTAATNALQQIEEKRYDQEFFDRGIQHILYLGFAFKSKDVVIHHKFKK